MNDKAAIMAFINNELVRGRINSELGDADNLVESGVIDSLGIQKLVSYLERTFSVAIADEDLVPDNFETVNAIWSFIHKCGN